jgi:hypothetical protein
LPEWNLADLYGGIDDPQVKRDLDRADAESLAFEEAYKGKLAALADGTAPGASHFEACKKSTPNRANASGGEHKCGSLGEAEGMRTAGCGYAAFTRCFE